MKLQSFIYRLYEKRLWKQIHKGPKPHHIGVVLDGNRRFAKQKNLDPKKGHSFGAKKVKDLLNWCWKLDIKIVTLYAFSTENFNRSEEEVEAIMSLLSEKLEEIITEPSIKKNKVKVRVIGRRDRLGPEIIKKIEEIEAKTSKHDNYTINIAISYGGRAEIVDAVRKIAKRIEKGDLSVEDINEGTINRNLYTKGMPDPDLIIRTSGEERLSGFLLWQSAYSELYFTEVFWPAFRKIDLWRAVRIYQQRERRYGK
ncbi:di-trans,poly-cis-decaprenylcistransferase [Candidatus Heimdallarchaeota archaeon]|nr:MAG: di-trans,poly-cis-decaprenylcistransferase [Candidatus Heimdallarchaeota archaeon]